jgi:general secretion pathway protein I
MSISFSMRRIVPPVFDRRREPRRPSLPLAAPGDFPARREQDTADSRLRHGRRGFTLLEVMIAMAILAISLVAVYQSQSQSVSMATDARFLTTAALLAQHRMAEIQAAPPGKTISGNGNFGDDFPDYTWQVDVSEVEESALGQRVVLSVTNQRMSGRKAFHLTLYRVVTP